MQHLLRRKIITIVISLFICQAGKAQHVELNLPDHDSKRYHFGINLGLNRSYFKFTHHPQFLSPVLNDSIAVIESINNIGINLAWLVNLNFNEHWDLRTYPLNLTFSEKAFEYTMTKFDPIAGESKLTQKKVQSITLSLPLLLKFSSDRIGNLKVFTTFGGRFDYDLASNANKKNAEELIKLRPYDYSVEGGIGFHFYFPYFVLSPELRVNWGLNNLHDRTSTLRYSSNVDRINARMISFSLTVE
ncbi:MAG TPA: porin family protein [Ferruginibacter sp.]|nr:porin family protein [Ferruginibacter sp.]HPH91741.1 porin family protein [Ferruginibacter sp.]